MTSQRERKWRVARRLKVATSLKLASPATIRRMTNVIRVVTTAKTIFTAEVMAGKTATAVQTRWEWSLTSSNPLGTSAAQRTNVARKKMRKRPNGDLTTPTGAQMKSEYLSRVS